MRKTKTANIVNRQQVLVLGMELGTNYTGDSALVFLIN
jgi:hypothetical protein